ncbi:ABC transporter permease [Micrococcales bacterium 31B]|nr:ABC transporter permease [Micrococcales bacterium 31B]
MPGAAPALRRCLSQGMFETRVLLSNGEQIMVSLLIPIAALVGLTKLDLGGNASHSSIELVAPSVLALAIVASAFTSQAIATGFDRRNGVLRLTATNPLGRSGWLVGKVISVIAVLGVQVVVLGAVAALLGWRPDLGGLPLALAAFVLGAWAFAAAGLALAGALRMEAILALANIIFIALAAAGGLLFSLDQMPAGLRVVAQVLPSGQLGEALRGYLAEGAAPWWLLAGLLAWALVFSMIVVKTFKWVSR